MDTLLTTLKVFQGMLCDLTINVNQVTRLAGESYMLATDLADYLVGKGMPFREAHGVMRQLCAHCEVEGKELQNLSIEEYHRFSGYFDESVYDITALASVTARDNPGGTAPNRVAEGLRQARQLLEVEGDGV